MKKFISLLLVLASTSVFALSELENLMIKEANSPESKQAARSYLNSIAKEKEANAVRHEKMAGNNGGKAISQAKFKEHCLTLAKEFRAEAEEYKKAAADLK
ncbi:LIC_10421 family protein [Leptospira noumeaensis]|nr:hypothetical protein [Leptospira noumeaensis]